MNEEAQKFLEAEETATKLVSTLSQLYDEAKSYQTATKELESVRQELFGLIESTKSVVEGSHEIIKTLKEIGALEILGRLTKLKFLVTLTLASALAALLMSIIAVLK